MVFGMQECLIIKWTNVNFSNLTKSRCPKIRLLKKSYHAVFSEMNIFSHNRQQIFILGQMKIRFLKYGVVKCSKILSILGTNLSRYIYFEFKCNTKLPTVFVISLLSCNNGGNDGALMSWVIGD